MMSSPQNWGEEALTERTPCREETGWPLVKMVGRCTHLLGQQCCEYRNIENAAPPPSWSILLAFCKSRSWRRAHGRALKTKRFCRLLALRAGFSTPAGPHGERVFGRDSAHLQGRIVELCEYGGGRGPAGVLSHDCVSVCL